MGNKKTVFLFDEINNPIAFRDQIRNYVGYKAGVGGVVVRRVSGAADLGRVSVTVIDEEVAAAIALKRWRGMLIYNGAGKIADSRWR